MPTISYNEFELLKASIQGNTTAFETIIKHYQSFICAITYSATGDIEKSEELAQETFLSAWKNLAQLKDLHKFRNWLSSITRNTIRNSFRSQKRDIMDKAVSVEYLENIGAKDSDSTETTITAQQQAVVRQALQQIPIKYREPFILFYRQEQSIKEVAEQLDLSEQAARQRLSRARKLLKQHVVAIVENTIRCTGPDTAFTAVIVAALPTIIPQAASAAIAATTAKGSLMAKSASILSTMGWILGPLLGFIGAIIAIRADLKNASHRERRFLIWSTSIQTAYLIILTLIAVPLCLWWKLHFSRFPWPILLIYFVLLFLPGIPFVIWCNRRQKQIQIEDGTYVKPQWRTLKMTKGQIYGAFGGAIFGSLVWLFRITIATDDLIAFWIVLASAALIFLIASNLCLKSPHHGFKIASGVFICVGILNLIVVNLQWDRWAAILNNRRVTIAQINWLIIAVITVLILIALIADWRHQKNRKTNN